MTQSDKKEKDKEMRKAESVPEKGKKLSRKAADKLKDGRLSVVGAANKLIKLGAKASAKKVIPEENEPWHGVEGTAETGANLPG